MLVTVTELLKHTRQVEIERATALQRVKALEHENKELKDERDELRETIRLLHIRYRFL